MKAQDLKIRCSALSRIITLDRSSTITEKQSETLKGLLSKVEITPAQAKTRDELTAKRDSPPILSAGAKTYIEELFYNNHFSFSKSFTNKYVQKGNLNESEAIMQICNYLDLPITFKNEKQFENEFITGMPDTIFKPLNFQLDVKNVYYPTGLDTFDDKIDTPYLWQAHGYDSLCEVDNGFVVKILTNPPATILDKEAKIMWTESGKDWSEPISDSFYNEVAEYFNFEKMPVKDRIKIYAVNTTEKDIKSISTAVKLSREYYGELLEKWESKNGVEKLLIDGLLNEVKI